MAKKPTLKDLNQSSNQTTSGRPEVSALNLQTKNGENVVLNAKRLEELFAQTELNILQIHAKNTSAEKKENIKTGILKSPELATQFLSRFGFKGPHDLIVFLSSPAGESTRRAIGEELAEIASMKKYNQFLMQEKEKRRHRLMALLLMYFTKKAEAKHRQQYNERSEHKKLENKKSKKQTYTQKSYADNLKENINNIDQALDRLDNELDSLRENKEKIEKTYQSNKEAIKESNYILNSILESLHEDIPTAIKDLHEKNIVLDDQIKHSNDPEEIQQLQEQKEINNGYISYLTGEKEISEIYPVKKLQEQIDDTNIKLMEKVDTLEPGQEHEASDLQNKIRQLGIQQARIIDVLQARMGTKEMVGLHFEQVSHDKVHYYLPKDKASELRQAGKFIAEEDGTNYLLQNGQDIESLSEDEKLKAKKAFNREIDPSNCEELGHQLDRNKHLALSENNEKTQQALEQKQIALAEKAYNTTELMQIESKQAKSQKELSKPASTQVPSNFTRTYSAILQTLKEQAAVNSEPEQSQNPSKSRTEKSNSKKNMTALSSTTTANSMKESLESMSHPGQFEPTKDKASISPSPFSIILKSN